MKRISALLILSVLTATAVQAQEAPAPRRMPRTPVSRETLAGSHEPMPASREMVGLAAIIDGERLRIGETDLRLFGIVPPQLSASFGPQARAMLDALANGQNVACEIRDRDRDGRLLATCHNAGGNDMALELLKHGLAVTARGSIAGTDLSNSYLAAEQAAQGQKIGLWSVTTTASAAPVAAAAPTAPVLLPPHIEATALPAEADSKKDDKVTPRTDKALAPDTQTQAKIVADVLSQQAQARLDESVSASGEEAGFFERYQILIAGFLMLATGFSITGALWAQKRRDRSDEIKSIAAALRGEMMAARSVCLGRAKTINDEAEDRAATWPRIRATLYQAYVGRLGILGAELARQIASLYGQMSDYAALNGANGLAQEAPKKHALETLARHIDEVLPRLADIERTGNIPASYRMVSVRPAPRYMPPSAPVSASPAVEEQPEPAPVYAVDEEAPAAIGSEVRAPRATPALWQAVREFIQSRRGALSTTPQEVDPNVAEYAAIIEADMARYKQGSRTENYDLYPKKKKI